LFIGAHRIIGHTTVNKKEPITPEILNKIVLAFGQSHSNLSDIRVCCMCLVSYAGFLSFSELANLRSGITISDSHVSLFIAKSKTDLYREGTNVLISRTYKFTCSVQYVRKIFMLQQTSTEFIFRSLIFVKSLPYLS